MSGWVLTRANVDNWKPGALSQLAETITPENAKCANEIRRLPGHVAGVFGAWSGAAYNAASDRVDEDHRQALKINEEVTDLENVLRQAGARLGDERTVLLGKVADAEHAPPIKGETYRVDDNWTLRVTFAADTPEDKRAEITRQAEGHQGLIDQAFNELRDAAREANRLILAAAQQILDAGNAVGEALDRPVIVGTEDPGKDPAVSGPPENATTTQSAAWWDGLTEQERREVIERHPEWIGNRDGIPASARHEANVGMLAGERQQLQNRLNQLNVDIDNHPTGGLFTNEDAERDQIKAKLASLDELDRLLKENPEQGRLLLLDTTGERVKAAFAIGDPDTAEHISVTTPGVDTTVDRSLSGMVGEAKWLQQETEKALIYKGDTDPKVATIAWIGYEPPLSKGGLDDKIEGWLGSAAEDRMRAGAPKLANFLEGLDTASTTPDPQLTALGHSYGSSTTALALQQLQDQGKPVVDNAVFYGSPGVFGADTAADLGLQPGHVFLAEADDDTIADLGRFGGDPADANFDNLSTHDGTTYAGEHREGVTGHSQYPHQGTITAFNFAMVVAGHPELAVR